MNCANCGGPLRPVPGRGYFVCEYCHSFHFPERSDANDDGVVSLNVAADISCPVCRQSLVMGEIARRRVFACGQCRGVCVRAGDFAEIVKFRRLTWNGPEEPQAPIDPRELQRQVRCPSCGGLMETHPYYGPGNAVIDTCSHCALIWLDHGELAMIERAPGRR